MTASVNGALPDSKYEPPWLPKILAAPDLCLGPSRKKSQFSNLARLTPRPSGLLQGPHLSMGALDGGCCYGLFLEVGMDSAGASGWERALCICFTHSPGWEQRKGIIGPAGLSPCLGRGWLHGGGGKLSAVLHVTWAVASRVEGSGGVWGHEVVEGLLWRLLTGSRWPAAEPQSRPLHTRRGQHLQTCGGDREGRSGAIGSALRSPRACFLTASGAPGHLQPAD